MTPRFLPALAAVLWLVAGVPAAQSSFFPVSDLKPGMIGTSRTVFEGAKLEEFSVQILGVLRNVVGPKRDLILARLSGGPLAETGVIAGMSGSPVYIDGRLLGAVSYALGQFSKEPIAGITPIGEMVDAAAMAPAAPGSRPVAADWHASPADLVRIWSRGLGRSEPFAADPREARIVSGDGDMVSARTASLLRPISLPLVTSGIDAAVLGSLAPALTEGGFVPVSAAGTGQAPPAGSTGPLPRLRGGDAVGVSLLSGDFALGSTGTVTYVDGDRLYAFGHPMYNLGPTEFPLTTADVHVVLPSLMQSSKLASFGEVIGTMKQDRATAISGRLGEMPSLIPVDITLNSDRSGSRQFAFSVVKDQTFTPLLTYLAVANVLTSYERAAGPASFTIRGTATLRQHGDLTFEDIFTGDQPAGNAAAYVAGPLTFLLKNSNEPVDVERVSLTIEATEKALDATIERVWLDTVRPRAGDTVEVRVALRASTGREFVKAVPITIPENASGSLQLLVADATRLSAEDRRETRGAEAQRVSQIIRSFNKARRSNRLYVRLSAPDQGAVVGGEALPALPPSVLAVLESDRNSGSFSPLGSATRGEWEIPVELAVTGSRLLTISLDRR
ncbi:MAG: SpoIVB peptidase S55 domain-containing protein [Vicinamibacterales bacterium]